MAELSLPEESIFAQALDIKSAAERVAFLDRACGNNQDQRAEVEALLRTHERSGDLLDLPEASAVTTNLPEASAVTTDLPGREGPGTVIGPYKLLQPIGEGGMGAVFMAEQTEPVQRKVALKLIKPGMDSGQVIARFEAERQALALMDHPNIAKVLDAGATEAGRPFFVMELVKGVPLTKYCDEHKLTPKQRLELFTPVCQAVQHAHQKGIIHRDLKPSNVLVALYDTKPVPKVIDFGIAKATGAKLTERTLFTEFGSVVGTLEYMSPEQAQLNQLDIDTRSDIYSLGVMLYELLTGTTPLERKRLKETGLVELLRIIREEEPPRPSARLSTTGELPAIAASRGLDSKKLSGTIRGELDWIVMKALEKDRDRRYDSANGFAADIQRYLADEPVLACPPSAAYHLRKFVRRRKTALAMAACVFLALTGVTTGVGWAVRDRSAREEEATRASAAREAALDDVVQRALVEAELLVAQERWPEALAAVERADQLLAAAGRAERPARLRELHGDLTLARRLEDAYQGESGCPPALAATTGGKSGDKFLAPQQGDEEDDFWDREQDAAFAGAFRESGIDVEALDPAEAAARVSRRSTRLALVRALDQWAALRRRARGDRDPGWRSFLDVAQRTDTDPWRGRLRDALLRKDRPALEGLAEAGKAQAPASVYLLGLALLQVGAVEKAMAVLREGQRRHPEDFWLNDALGSLIYRNFLQPPRYDDALRYYTAALAIRPQSAQMHCLVAEVHAARNHVDEAILEAREAIRVQKDYERAHELLGAYLWSQGQRDAAVMVYRGLLKVKPGSRAAYIQLGRILGQRGQTLDEAIGACREAIRIDQDDAQAHHILAEALWGKGRGDEALTEYREAIRAPHYRHWQVDSHISLGRLLCERGEVEEGIAHFRQAILLRPDYGDAHYALGGALYSKGQLDEAIAQLREAIRLFSDPNAHFVLGNALADKGQLEEACVAYRGAIRLFPEGAVAYCKLGNCLRGLGKYPEALAELRRGHELGSQNPRWPLPSDRWVRECERLVKLEGKLAGFLDGSTMPAGPDERVGLAEVCSGKQLHRAAARFYDEAMLAEPKLANDVGAAHRYNAACAAALAGCGQGKDADQLDAKEKERLRGQALGWLQADLAMRAKQLAGKPTDGADVQATLRHWQVDADLAGVRGPGALARLPEAERQPWQNLWDDLADTLARAQPKMTPEKKSDAK